MSPLIIYSWSAVILWIGVYQCLVMAPYFFARKAGSQLSNRLMGFFVLMMGFRLLTAIDEFSQPDILISKTTQLAGILTVLYGPFLYFYLKTSIERQFHFRRKHIWHLLPVSLLFIFWGIFLFLQPGPMVPPRELMIEGKEPPLIFLLLGTAVALLALTYMFMSIRLILRFQRYVRTNASYSNKQYFRWLLFLAGVILLPVLSPILTVIVVEPVRVVPYPTYGVSLMVSFILMIALLRPEILNGLPETLQVDEVEELEPKRYESSSLAEDQKSQYLGLLIAEMESKRPFLQQELTLNQLASHLGINAKYLSQIINEKQGQNFMDFINGYRIQEAKKMLLSPAYQYYTILAIAQESGFKSKSAFYNAFKKVTGMTPSAFKKEAREEV